MRIAINNFRRITPTSILARSTKGGGKFAFTLVELLVVMSIIAILLAIGVPAFKFIGNSHSAAAALNEIKPMLARARQDALANQRTEGLVIFYDQLARQYCLAIVAADPAQTDPTFVDFTSTTDFQYLPAGVGVRVIAGNAVADAAQPTAQQTRTTNGYLRLGVIMYDARGCMVNVPFQISASSSLGIHIGKAVSTLTSQVGFALYDDELFQNAGFNINDVSIDGGGPYNNQANPITCDLAKDAWLDGNASPYLVDRYSGGVVEVSAS